MREQILDIKYLEGVFDKETIKNLLEAYIEEFEQQMLNIEEALESGNKLDLAIHAHQMKGASSNIGSPYLTDCFADIELYAKSGQLIESSFLGQAKTALVEIKKTLESLSY
jgi:HPt (histidine-containing phosphotransfer) domain-containing protein